MFRNQVVSKRHSKKLLLVNLKQDSYFFKIPPKLRAATYDIEPKKMSNFPFMQHT